VAAADACLGRAGALLALALAALLWRGLRRWHANRHRRRALAELRRLRAQLQAVAPPARRLQAARRWAYRPEAALPWDELDALLALLERWIRHHRTAQESA